MTARSTSSSQPKSWIELINESVHTSDDIDIGDIDAISRDLVVEADVQSEDAIAGAVLSILLSMILLLLSYLLL